MIHKSTRYRILPEVGTPGKVDVAAESEGRIPSLERKTSVFFF